MKAQKGRISFDSTFRFPPHPIDSSFAIPCPPRTLPKQAEVHTAGNSGSLPVLRPTAATFFGKTIKVFPIMTLYHSTSFPNLRILRCSVVAVFLSVRVLCVSISAIADEPSANGQSETVYDRSDQNIPPQSVGPSMQGERIVSTTLAGFARAQSVSARIRQRVRIGNRVLVGSGRYVQQGTGIDQRFRYEVSMECDSERFDVLEVCDGIFHWTYRNIGSNPAQLSRLDVRQVRQKLEQLNVLDRFGASPYLGGIQRSFALTRQWYHFETVESASIDNMPVWSVLGTWNTTLLSSLLPEQAEKIQSAEFGPSLLPDGMPWSVRVSIGKQELFPFRFEWLAIPGKRPVADTTLETIAVMELYDVQIDGPIDTSAFVYKPAVTGMIDITDGYVESLAPMRP